jgi:diguanylate cyclase (GGDEF)-like protein
MKLWGLVMFDIDNFKAFNSNHTYDGGDAALATVARAAAGALGKRGFLFRRGGEEFVAVLRGTRVKDTEVAAENAVVMLPDGGKARVTVSVGVTGTPEISLNPSEMHGDAERAMVAAKQQGKNRVVVALEGGGKMEKPGLK